MGGFFSQCFDQILSFQNRRWAEGELWRHSDVFRSTLLLVLWRPLAEPAGSTSLNATAPPPGFCGRGADPAPALRLLQLALSGLDAPVDSVRERNVALLLVVQHVEGVRGRRGVEAAVHQLELLLLEGARHLHDVLRRTYDNSQRAAVSCVWSTDQCSHDWI